MATKENKKEELINLTLDDSSVSDKETGDTPQDQEIVDYLNPLIEDNDLFNVINELGG